MFPNSFQYHRATSVDDAVAMLSANPDAKILAGGHSLIPAMKLRLAAPEMLIDLTRVSELKGVTVGPESVTIGAMSTYNDLRDAEGIADLFPSIVESIGVIGDQQVRAHGTIGGALAHNDPAADLTAVFLSLGGSVVAQGPNGERTIAGEDLFVDLWTTSLEMDEVITRVILPVPSAGSRSAYRKHAHPASGYAVVGVAVAIDGAGQASVVVTGATSIPTHAAGAERALAGADSLDETTITAAADAAPAGLELNPSPYASEAYLAQLIRVLTSRALTQAASR